MKLEIIGINYYQDNRTIRFKEPLIYYIFDTIDGWIQVNINFDDVDIWNRKLFNIDDVIGFIWYNIHLYLDDYFSKYYKKHHIIIHNWFKDNIIEDL